MESRTRSTINGDTIIDALLSGYSEAELVEIGVRWETANLFKRYINIYKKYLQNSNGKTLES